ncbi:AcrB/AcrD/AcrF family protein [Sphingomonas sp. AOB5]|uniref:AcrB/AcrD/AcrF family protein n=1 Tax=Sphingomonas sp. AOB5 TaxID=3034017 RepID=UPI0023F828C7|nr:AcrB/AcrD/AcrF family protein [Sphingomonas sp. AOB5]MDF7776986.1 AcrB/AcrD/AcrF family protein [Sphingomonas sp. AOB5]
MKLGKDGAFRLDDELDRHWLNWSLLFWVAVCAWFVWDRHGNIQWLALGDTDDNMRLMQVRALLAGQGWYDLTNYRLDPALGGFNIHWSRLVDLPIAGLILLLQPFIGTAQAEKWACGIAPMLPLAVTMIGVALTVRRLIAPQAWPIALVVLMGCTSTMMMFAPMRIDHHGWQLACLAMTVAGLADPRRARGGATVGISSAVSLTIGLEMLPYCAMAGAIIALRWVWDAGDARRMQVYGITLAGGSGLGFALFASDANQAMRCDALTPVWLSVMIAGGGLLFALSLLNPANRWVRLGLGAVAGAAIAGGFAWFFPQCLGRPEGVSDELQQVWLNNVREARPIYRHSLESAFPIAALPVIGIIGAGVAIWRWRKSQAVVGWAAVGLFTAFAGAMLLWQVRAGPAAQLLSVAGSTALVWIVVPWCLRQKWMAVRVIGSVAVFLVASGLFAGYVIKYLPKEAKPAARSSSAVNNANAMCARMTSMRMLDRAIPPSILFTHVDLGPRLIVMTRHSGIAGPYHRNGRAILDVHKAFTGTAAQFRPIAKAHGAQYLLVCPNLAETTVYRARSPQGFYTMLRPGKAPSWLIPVKLPEGAPYRLWKIDYSMPDDAPVVRHQPAPPPGRP